MYVMFSLILSYSKICAHILNNFNETVIFFTENACKFL